MQRDKLYKDLSEEIDKYILQGEENLEVFLKIMQRIEAESGEADGGSFISLAMYGWYMFPREIPERKVNLERLYGESQKRDSGTFWDTYHYASFLFDEGNYAEFLEKVTLLPNPLLFCINIGQIWRFYKLVEVHAVALIKLKEFEKGYLLLDILIDGYKTTLLKEEIPPPDPVEIIKALEEELKTENQAQSARCEVYLNVFKDFKFQLNNRYK